MLLYGYTTWTLRKCSEKKLNGNNTRIPHTVLKKSWKYPPKKVAERPLTSHLATSVDQPAKTYVHQLCADTGYGVGDLLGAMTDRDRWCMCMCVCVCVCVCERERESKKSILSIHLDDEGFIQLLTRLDLTQSHFIVGRHSGIKTHPMP